VNNPWNAITPPSKDVSARRVDHTHSLNLFWARDQQGKYLFICELDSLGKNEVPRFPDLAAIQVLFVPDGAKARLVLILAEQSSWELFLALCQDLVETTRAAKNSGDAVNIIQRRLLRWHEFLKQNRPRILSEEQIKGLIGELVFLRDHAVPLFGASEAVKNWKGPEGSPQDFNAGDTVIEVKCQSGATAPRIRISSPDQMSPQMPQMYLFVVTLGSAAATEPGAVNLPLLISETAALLSGEAPGTLERFNDLLCQAGYAVSDKYLEYSYLLVDRRIFSVEEGFPRITAGQVPPGISHLTYCIDLAACEPFEISIKEWEAHYGCK
jgi:hypothetical protein